MPDAEIIKELKELVKEFKPFFSWTYGSFLRENFEKIYDIDVVVVTKELKDEKDSSANKIRGKPIDLLFLPYDVVERKVEFNDYYLASLIEYSQFLEGNEEIYNNVKANTFKKTPTRLSQLYNRREGIELFDRARGVFEWIKTEKRFDYAKRLKLEELYIFENLVINNRIPETEEIHESNSNDDTLTLLTLLSWSFGYLLVSKYLPLLNKTISLGILDNLESCKDKYLLFYLLERKKNVKRGKKLNTKPLEDLINDVYHYLILTSSTTSSEIFP
jgi:predicted nucleotidyltransferase